MFHGFQALCSTRQPFFDKLALLPDLAVRVPNPPGAPRRAERFDGIGKTLSLRYKIGYG